MVCRAAFGQVSKEDQYEFVRLMKQVAALGGGFDIADLFPSYKILHVLTGLKPKLQKIHHKMDIIFENLIKEHVKNQTRKKKFIADSNQEDLIDVLLRIRDSEDLQFPITNDNIKAIIFVSQTTLNSFLLCFLVCLTYLTPKLSGTVWPFVNKLF